MGAPRQALQECYMVGCSIRPLARGMCSRHYEKWRRYGDPFVADHPKGPPPRPKKSCSVEGCLGVAAKRTWCVKHYSRWKRWGDVGHTQYAPKEVVEGVKAAKAKKLWIDAYKLEQGCFDCGYAKHPAALDFDHLPGTVKRRDIRSGQGFEWVALRREIALCEVVCANCHRIRTVERNALVREEVQVLRG